MFRRRWQILIPVFLSLTSLSLTEERELTPDPRGSISNHTYTNRALGMTINLPGEWGMLDMTSETPNDPSCTGPLCGPPDIYAVLQTRPTTDAPYRLYVSAWKLAAQYLNRNRYPLDW